MSLTNPFFSEALASIPEEILSSEGKRNLEQVACQLFAMREKRLAKERLNDAKSV